MVTHAGANKLSEFIHDGAGSFLYIAYGSGTTAESKDHTALVSETSRVLASTRVTSALAKDDSASFFAEDRPTAAGTINEIGVFSASSGGTMLLRKKLTTGVTYTDNARVFLLATITIKDDGYIEAS